MAAALFGIIGHVLYLYSFLLSGPRISIAILGTSDGCKDVAKLIRLIALPRAAVFMAPLCFEYLRVGWSHYGWKRKHSDDDQSGNVI